MLSHELNHWRMARCSKEGPAHQRRNDLMHDDITDIPGIRVGHDTDLEAGTGCTVILCDTPAVGGVDVRGGAPATRETDLLHPMHMVEEVHAIVLAGGSAYGLDAASGVMPYLVEHNTGFDTGGSRATPWEVLFLPTPLATQPLPLWQRAPHFQRMRSIKLRKWRITAWHRLSSLRIPCLTVTPSSHWP